jgi:hypothetical protein
MSSLYICLYSQFEVLQTTPCLRVVHALRDKVGCFRFAPSLFGYFILVPITYISLRFNP